MSCFQPRLPWLLLSNPDDRAVAQAQVREVLSAARNLGLKVHVLNAGSEGEFDGSFRGREAFTGRRACD